VRAILHSDLNSYYASVEMMLNPSLRGKAVAVCGSTENRHGIVLAKSELAKMAGVKTGMVNWEAKRCCPNLIMVQPNFEQYIKYSALARNIYGRYTDQIEPYGMDECWLDITGSSMGSPLAIAESIRETIKNELGLTVKHWCVFHKNICQVGKRLKKAGRHNLHYTGKLPKTDMGAASIRFVICWQSNNGEAAQTRNRNHWRHSTM